MIKKARDYQDSHRSFLELFHDTYDTYVVFAQNARLRFSRAKYPLNTCCHFREFHLGNKSSRARKNIRPVMPDDKAKNLAPFTVRKRCRLCFTYPVTKLENMLFLQTGGNPDIDSYSLLIFDCDLLTITVQ